MITLLDFAALAVGLVYILLEYRASIWVWAAGIVMPAIDLWLYWERGLYGDFGLAVYYLGAGLYGYMAWRSTGRTSGGRTPSPPVITHFPPGLLPIARLLAVFLAVWAGVWAFLACWTDSTVPVTDSLTNALSIVGLWMLSRKYVEQWYVWIVADAVYVWLYAHKGLPFKSALYALYVIIAFFGLRRWLRMMREASPRDA